MAAPVKIVASGGWAVSEAVNSFGVPLTPVEGNAPAVTITAAGGMPVIFVSVDGVLWPGGIAPDAGSFLLLVDGASFLLLTNGTDRLVLAGPPF